MERELKRVVGLLSELVRDKTYFLQLKEAGERNKDQVKNQILGLGIVNAIGIIIDSQSTK